MTVTFNQSTQVVNAGFYYINGAVISNDTVVPNTRINVSAGQLRDHTNTFDLNIGNFGGIYPGQSANAVTTIDATTNGINGLDTGSLAASTVYYVYVVADTRTGNPTGAMLSVQSLANGPYIPTGYDSYRLIGFVKTDASVHFNLFYVSGDNNARTFFFDAPQPTSITAGAATSFTAINLSALVPPLDNLPLYINSSYVPATAGNQLQMKPFTAAATGVPVIITGQVATVAVTTMSKVFSKLTTLGVPEIHYKVGNASDTAAINVAGFDFYV